MWPSRLVVCEAIGTLCMSLAASFEEALTWSSLNFSGMHSLLSAVDKIMNQY